jgi:putative spermidine/putrescine transport system ATP-binding protein/spermidine/putrescine transport system ATP-binding protein
MVSLRGIVKRFGNLTAVAETDLDIAEGELVTLLGPSGCGKTTILRMIAGLETPTEGDIFIRGNRVTDTPVHKRNLGMIFQNYALFPHKTIFDNVAFGLKYRSASKAEMTEKVRRALDMVRLPGVENRKPSQLSGGQQQRIAMARAIVIEPDVLLMDEPLSALDEKLRQEMRLEIDNLQRMLKVTTVFVTHDQREALSMSDRIIVMKDGVTQQEGSPEEVYNNPTNRFVADFLGQSNFFSAVVAGREDKYTKVKLTDGSELIVDQPGEWSEGREVDVVIRAQKYQLHPKGEYQPRPGYNYLDGRIYDRSYMGGETSYFIELASGAKIQVIALVRQRPYKRDEEVSIEVAAGHCRLLPREAKAA